ncbi:MAG TPA: bifunctional precorrin-2 dehydrogenase/sirohydrochlorin ferrochelatase [Gemmataceae bacterium]|nr:bifunctional precorrin-2 dehydrogenase/sirohydrochlorin ferrochelatase [Gemmataceae bacterium]
MLPLFINLRDRLCLVIGGGAVGRRKGLALLEAGARVRLIWPEGPPGEQTAPRLERVCGPYRPEHLDGVSLVIAAATPEVNRQVVADARARGIWVNSATEPDEGDFHMAATVRRGEFVVAVHTGGHAPALAREVCDRLEDLFDETFAVWVALLAELRPLIRKTVAAPLRRPLLKKLCAWTWLERLRAEGRDAVRTAMYAEMQALAQGPRSSL